MDRLIPMGEDEIKEKKELLVKLQVDLDENIKVDLAKRSDFRKLSDEKIIMETDLAENAKQTRHVSDTINSLVVDKKKLNSQIMAIKQALDDNERKNKILEKGNTFPTFYETVHDRLTRIQDEFIAPAMEFKHPDKFVKELQHDIEKGGISEYLVFVRNVRGRYMEYVQTAATNIIDGIGVTPKEVLAMNEYLDKFLKDDRMTQRWN